MSQAAALVRFILGSYCACDDDAQALIAHARALGVDPLDYCAARFPLGSDHVAERGAAWAGLAFSPRVPIRTSDVSEILRIDAIAQVRTIRARLFDREVVYAAPRFDGLIGLRAHVEANSGLRTSICIVPAAAIRAAIGVCSQEQLLTEARQRLARRWPYSSGHLDLTLTARALFALTIALVLFMTVAAPFWFQWLFVPLVGVLLIVPAIVRLIAVGSQQPKAVEPPPLGDEDLPVYTILIPLRDEAPMVQQLHRAMSAIDYPPEKLDIKFVVESRSLATVAAVETVLGDPRFELVSVPDAAPRTKPKALNYALPFVRGKHLVVYDAEDIPDPAQLRLAASLFAADPGVDCLQAELVVDNANENWLSGLFAGEYAGQFGLMLPLLAAWRLPMPLGGTSNHFNTSALRQAGGWDAFNVTEDADLGVRLARLRYRTATLASRTREEAPITLGAWMAQRTRWMKGWMQTYVVHTRSPRRFLDDIGWKGFLAFQIYVGSMILSALLHTAFAISLGVSVLIFGQSAMPDDLWGFVNLAILVVGYGAAIVIVVAGLLRIEQRSLLTPQLLLPFYWMLHAIAAFRALVQLFTRPYFWAKTQHGRTKVSRPVVQEPGESERPPVSANREPRTQIRDWWVERVKGIEPSS